MLRHAIYAAAVLAAGCATAPRQETTCLDYAIVLQRLAVQRSAGLLSRQEIARVDAVRPYANLYCSDEALSGAEQGRLGEIVDELEAMAHAQ